MNEFSMESKSLSVGILIHSRTVLEKKDYVSTGVLTFAEGDILELELSEYKMFELGDVVKATIYSPGGIYTFKSNVIALDDNTVIILNPPENQKKFVERREHPRIDTEQKGLIHSIQHETLPKKEFGKPLSITINNVSLGGVGFYIHDELDISQESQVSLNMDIGVNISFMAEVVRREESEYGTYYGARYIQFPDDKMNSLRAFVLREQVQNHLAKKKKEIKKRLFK